MRRGFWQPIKKSRFHVEDGERILLYREPMDTGLAEHSSLLLCHSCYYSAWLIEKHIGRIGSSWNRWDRLSTPKRHKWIKIDESDESEFTVSL